MVDQAGASDRVMIDRSQVVYRLFDEAGQLLYLGVAADPGRRFAAHRRSAHWWPQVTKITLERYGERDHAEAVESQAISREAPIYNKMGRRPDAVPRTGLTPPPLIQGPMRNRVTRIPDDEWEAFGKAVGGRYRSQVVREMIAWYIDLPGAEEPTRPSVAQLRARGVDAVHDDEALDSDADLRVDAPHPLRRKAN